MKNILVISSLLSLILFFQNCSGVFESVGSGLSTTQSSKCFQSNESKLADDQVLIGDMILPVRAVESLQDVQKYWPEKEKYYLATSTENTPVYEGVTTEYINSVIWDDGILPLNFDASVSESTKIKVFAACEKISEVADVKCIERTNQPYFVTVVEDRQGCSATVGRYSSSILNLSSAVCKNEMVMIHELMHNFGVKHEQQHPDRDEHIRIIDSNIIQAARKNFVAIKTTPLKTAFDFDSIMLYSSGSASIGRAYPSMVRRSPACDAIERTNFPSECFFTQSRAISSGDKEIMELLYGSVGGGAPTPKPNPSPAPPTDPTPGTEDPEPGTEEPPATVETPPDFGEEPTDCSQG